MNFKHFFLVILLLCSVTHATDTTPSLNEKLAGLRNGKSVNLNKEELIALLGKPQVDTLLGPYSVQIIKEDDDEEIRSDFFLGFGLGAGMVLAGILMGSVRAK